MTQTELDGVLTQYPDLTASGFGRQHGDDRPTLEGCNRVMPWLERQQETAKVCPFRTSYGLKHEAEPEVGYVTNGEFIAAAIHLGFQVQRTGLNAFLNMAKPRQPARL
jgi:hypothetical protein